MYECLYVLYFFIEITAIQTRTNINDNEFSWIPNLLVTIYEYLFVLYLFVETIYRRILNLLWRIWERFNVIIRSVPHACILPSCGPAFKKIEFENWYNCTWIWLILNWFRNKRWFLLMRISQESGVQFCSQDALFLRKFNLKLQVF